MRKILYNILDFQNIGRYRHWSWYLLAASCVILLARRVFVIITIHNQSMEPTLYHGDRVLAVRYWPTRLLRHNQIVLVCWPWPEGEFGPGPFGFVPYIKRIRGLPGDKIVTQDNGVIDPIDLDNTSDAQLNELPLRKWFISEGYIFVQGDNPRRNMDSRRWGPVPIQSVVGVVVKRMQPNQAPFLCDEEL